MSNLRYVDALNCLQ